MCVVSYMGKTIYSKCEDLIEAFRDAGREEIHETELIAAIARLIGSDQRTIKNAINTLIVTELIIPKHNGNYEIGE